MTDLIEIDVLLLGAGGGILLPRSFSPAPGFASSLVDPIANLGGNCPTEGCVSSKAGFQYALATAMSRKTIPPGTDDTVGQFLQLCRLIKWA